MNLASKFNLAIPENVNHLDRHDGWCVFFEVRPERRDLYAELGLTLTPLGEEARVNLRAFTLDTPAQRDLRQACAKLRRHGLRFEVVPPESVPPLLPTLEGISRAWLSRKATSEKGFSNASFDAAYLSRFPAARSCDIATRSSPSTTCGSVPTARKFRST